MVGSVRITCQVSHSGYTQAVSATRFQFVGGHPTLDFVNTVEWRNDRARRTELLRVPADLAAWARQAGLITAAAARGLVVAAQRQPRRAERALLRARRLRDVLARVLDAAGRGARPSARDVRRLDAFVATALRARRLEARATGLVWVSTAAADDLAGRVLWPLVLGAAALLTSPELARVRACADLACGWFFLDTSRSHRRRWCTMESCGNRAKARRFYERGRQSADVNR